MNNELTDRESDVMDMLSTGKRNKEIAEALFISENTVESHMKTIFKKLGVRNRVEATTCARGQVETVA